MNPIVQIYTGAHVFNDGYVAIYLSCKNAIWYRLPGRWTAFSDGLKLVPITDIDDEIVVSVYGLFQKKTFRAKLDRDMLSRFNSNPFKTSVRKFTLTYKGNLPPVQLRPTIGRARIAPPTLSKLHFTAKIPKPSPKNLNLTLKRTTFELTDFL